MPLIFYDVPTWLGGAVLIGLFTLFAAAGIELVCRLHPTEFRRGYNDITGFIIAVIGVMNAVLLASVAIIALENYDRAERSVTREASYLGDILRMATALPPEPGEAVRLAALEYGNAVLDQEWPDMRKSLTPREGWPRLNELRDTVMRFEPATMRQQNIHGHMITMVDDLTDARRERITFADEGIKPTVWRVLFLGNLGMVAFSFLFGLDKRWHQLLSGSFAALTALVIVLIAALDRPYLGEVSITPNELQKAISRMER